MVGALAGALAACASGLPRPGPDDARRASAMGRPGTTVADLDAGRSLYAAKCSGCHALKAPAAHGPDAWAREVNDMAARAYLRPDEAVRILAYLTAMSARPAAADARAHLERRAPR